MTEPTDKELRAWVQSLIADDDGVRTNDERDHMNFARAVIAKFGTPPAVAGEPVGEVQHLHELNDEWLSKLPIGTKLYTTPQPTQAQAGAVPLTDEQIDELIAAKHFREGYERKASDLVCINWYRMGLRDGEHAHGIGIKGGQHGADQ